MSDNWIESVRLPPAELQRLLDSLDAQENFVPAELRRSPRRAYRCDRVMIQILTGNPKTESTFRVTGRNISGGGLAFLHGQVIAVDTRLHVQIPAAEGGWRSLFARVVRCRHVKGMIHEVAVQFVGSRGGAMAPALRNETLRT